MYVFRSEGFAQRDEYPSRLSLSVELEGFTKRKVFELRSRCARENVGHHTRCSSMSGHTKEARERERERVACASGAFSPLLFWHQTLCAAFDVDGHVQVRQRVLEATIRTQTCIIGSVRVRRLQCGSFWLTKEKSSSWHVQSWICR